MSFILIEVHDEEFQAWLDRLKNSFRSMIETMKDVAKVVRENTIPLTPVETTRLGKSFKWTVLENNSKFQVVQVRMSALNPRTGYDYAWVQHRGYHINKNGTMVNYRHNGSPNLGDSWLKVVNTHGYYPSDVGMLHVPTDLGGDGGIGPEYLYRGIRASMDDAFELIETDYLSLFTSGGIY